MADRAAFIADCFAAVGLTTGAFHVEVKYWESRKRWEIIEINPRMGGSLICASVAAITGASVFDLWIRSMLADAADLPALHEHLRQCSQIAPTGRNGRMNGDRAATLFISKYVEKGRVIDSIAFTPDDRPPAVFKLHEKAGSTLADSNRALCLMDAMWEVDGSQLSDEIAKISSFVESNFHIQYRYSQQPVDWNRNMLHREAPDSDTVDRLTVRLVEIPLDTPRMTGAGAMTSFPFVLLDLETHGGATGRSYVFAYDRIVSPDTPHPPR